MAVHQNLKPSDQEIPLLLAGQALSRVDGLASRPMGAVSLDNADGSQTLIGGSAGSDDAGTVDSDLGVPGGVVSQVGKTSLPGTPGGLAVSSTGLTVVLTWDGSFRDSRVGAVRVEAVLTDADGKKTSMGSLSTAGSLTALATVPGMATISVTAYDDAHDSTGAAAPNKSATVTLDVVLSELVDSEQITDAVDANRKTLEQAQKDLADHASKISQTQTDIADAKKKIDDAEETLADNQTALDQAQKDIAQAKSDAQSATQAAGEAKSSVAAAQSAADKAATDAATALADAATASDTAGKASTAAGAAQSAADAAGTAASKAQDTAGKAATDAATALSTADSADSTAAKAQQTADSANSAASSAGRNAATALTNANTALQRAKNITFSQTAPTNPSVGDIWYPKDGSGKTTGMKTWGGSAWTDVTLMAGGIIVPGSIGSTLIGDGQISAPKILSGAVTADKLAADSVQADKIAAGAITAGSIASGAVTTDKLAANAVNADKLAANAVTASKIASGSIDAGKIVAGSITGEQIAGETIDASKLVAGTITGDRLAAGSVNSDKIAADAITADKLAANSVDASKIKGNKLIGTEIQTGESYPYMLLTEKYVNLPDIDTYNSGQLQFIGGKNKQFGGFVISSGTGTPAGSDVKSNDSSAYIYVTNPGDVVSADRPNQIVIHDSDEADSTGDSDNRNIYIASRRIALEANDENNNYCALELSPYGLGLMKGQSRNVLYIPSHECVYSRTDAAAQGQNEEVVIDSAYTLDDYDFLDIEYVTNSQQVHGSQRFYKPTTGTWVGYKMALSLNYFGLNNVMYVFSNMMTVMSENFINCTEQGNQWLRGQYPTNGQNHANAGDVMWVTRIEGWKD